MHTTCARPMRSCNHCASSRVWSSLVVSARQLFSLWPARIPGHLRSVWRQYQSAQIGGATQIRGVQFCPCSVAVMASDAVVVFLVPFVSCSKMDVERRPPCRRACSVGMPLYFVKPQESSDAAPGQYYPSIKIADWARSEDNAI